MLAFFRICRYNLYCALRRRIEVVITGLTRNQVASRGLEGSNPSVSASATGNAFKRCLIFTPLRRRKRRARAPARARAARDCADRPIFSYILSLPPIAERRIPPSRGVTGTVILSVALFHLVAPAETESPSPCEGSSCTRLGNHAVTFLYALRANDDVLPLTLALIMRRKSGRISLVPVMARST